MLSSVCCPYVVEIKNVFGERESQSGNDKEHDRIIYRQKIVVASELDGKILHQFFYYAYKHESDYHAQRKHHEIRETDKIVSVIVRKLECVEPREILPGKFV